MNSSLKYDHFELLCKNRRSGICEDALRSHEAFVLDLVLASKLQLSVSSDILAEYAGALRRPRFRIDSDRLTQ